MNITRDAAWELLKKYNKEPFHLQHGLTVEGIMKWYADSLGYQEDADFWAIAGLLHDVDFEAYPEEHLYQSSGTVGRNPGRRTPHPCGLFPWLGHDAYFCKTRA